MPDKYTLKQLAERFDLVSHGDRLGLLDNDTSRIYTIAEDEGLIPLCQLAMDEMQNPVGAFDKVLPNDEHPLSWLAKEDNMPNTNLRPLDSGNVASSVRKRFGVDQEDQLTPDDLLQFVRLCIDGLGSPEERDKFLAGLSTLVQMEQQAGATDARRGNRFANRRPAQDAALRTLNLNNWEKKFPYMHNVKTTGY